MVKQDHSKTIFYQCFFFLFLKRKLNLPKETILPITKGGNRIANQKKRKVERYRDGAASEMYRGGFRGSRRVAEGEGEVGKVELLQLLLVLLEPLPPLLLVGRCLRGSHLSDGCRG